MSPPASPASLTTSGPRERAANRDQSAGVPGTAVSGTPGCRQGLPEYRYPVRGVSGPSGVVHAALKTREAAHRSTLPSPGRLRPYAPDITRVLSDPRGAGPGAESHSVTGAGQRHHAEQYQCPDRARCWHQVREPAWPGRSRPAQRTGTVTQGRAAARRARPNTAAPAAAMAGPLPAADNPRFGQIPSSGAARSAAAPAQDALTWRCG